MVQDHNIKNLLARADALTQEINERVRHGLSKETLEELRLEYFGRARGKIKEITAALSSLSVEEKKLLGARLNTLKQVAEIAFSSAAAVERVEPAIDASLPGIRPAMGHAHPLIEFLTRVVGIFQAMGFEVADGPEVETEQFNFDLLNVPAHHTARDMPATFWPTSEASRQKLVVSRNQTQERLLLRTHTSSVQLRAMLEKDLKGTFVRRPPVRLIVPGRVFRNEATDASHETTFYQCEGLVIDQGIRVSDLIGTLKVFLHELFGSAKIRVRPHYYPFVEPGMDVDMACLICSGTGCSVCKRTGWLEMLGSGMVHPQVLRNMKIEPATYSGFAFGMGIDRFMMLYYGIHDVRLSWSGDLRFLEQF